LLSWVRGRGTTTAENALVLERTFALFAVACFSLSLLFALQARLLARETHEENRADAMDRPELRLKVWTGLWISLFVGIVLALPIATAHLNRPFDFDETIEIALDVEGPIWAPIRPRAFANHASGAWLARPGWQMFENEAAARTPFVLLGVATAGLLGLSAAMVTRRTWVAGATSLLVCSHWLFCSYLVSIRGYGVLWFSFAALLAAWVACHEGAFDARTQGTMLTLVVVAVSALGGAAHLFGFVALGLWVLVGLLHWGWASGADSAGAKAAGAVLTPAMSVGLLLAFAVWAPSLPWLFFQTGHSGDSNGGTAALLDELWALLGVGLGRDGLWNRILGLSAVAALGVAGGRQGAHRPPLLAAELLVALSAIAALVLSPRFFFSRFLVAALPAFLIAVAVGAARVRYGAGVILVLASVLASSSLMALQGFPDSRHAVLALEGLVRRSSPNPRILVVGSDQDRIVVRFYSSLLATADEAESPPRSSSGEQYIFTIDRPATRTGPENAGSAPRCQILAPTWGSQSSFLLLAPAESWVCRNGKGVA